MWWNVLRATLVLVLSRSHFVRGLTIFKELPSVFNAHQVAYLIVGGYAVSLYEQSASAAVYARGWRAARGRVRSLFCILVPDTYASALGATRSNGRGNSRLRRVCAPSIAMTGPRFDLADIALR